MSKSKAVPVIFRAFKDNGHVIALFPTQVGDCRDRSVMSYMHVGQHGAADLGVISRTRPATAQEAAQLAKELRAKPYEYVLKPAKKVSTAMRTEYARAYAQVCKR